jgi:hypothetical protein
MIMAQERSILKAKAQLDQVADVVRRACDGNRSIDQVEGDLWQQMQQIGLSMLNAFVQGQGSGDLGPTIEHDGRTLRRLDQKHDRRYVSVFGELTIERTVYGSRETQKHEVVPLDAILNLPEGDFSYVLQQWDQMFCVQGSYGQSRQTVQQILGIGQSVRTLEHMNVSMAGAVESFQASRPTPPSAEEGSIVVLTADGKGVPMRRDSEVDPPRVRGRRSKGQKANKKRQACVGAVYTIDPFVRTAQDVVDELMRDECQADRPVPRHKELRAELSRPLEGVEVNGKERIFSWFSEQVETRNPKGDKPVVCVMDGDRALWKMLGSWLVNVVCILDLFHVMERLWTAAHCFHPEGSEAAKAFVSDRLERILNGEVGRVIGGMRQMGTKQHLRGSRAKQLSAVIGYLERNRQFMHYDEYLANGYPIGSGVAEGACRHLVKDRMELTGMRWRLPGAQAMLDLRAVYLNDDWDRFQAHRIKTECRRLYPYRTAVIRSKRRRAA